ncbi:MAG: hypothetical protein ABSF71_24060 [Terriglobia bacterium]
MDDQTNLNQLVLDLARTAASLAVQVRIHRDTLEIAHIKMHPKYEPQFRRFQPLLEKLETSESLEAGGASPVSATPLGPQASEALRGILDQVRSLLGTEV